MTSGDWNRALERALELFAQLVGEDPALEREFAATQAAFGRADESPAERILAERRHLEWFVCERPSDHLEGVPVEALREAWEARAEGAAAELADVLLCSLAGAYEVLAIESGGTLLVRDLFGFAELEITEPEAAGALEAGDLLVGRLFPVTPELFRLSPATELFRDRALVGALRGDVERMRAGGARVLRMQQSELEALFFVSAREGTTPPSDAAADPPAERDPGRARADAAAALVAAGLDAGRARETVAEIERLGREERPGLGVVTEVLNVLAFETDVDLEVARRTLLELWSALRPEPVPPRARSATPEEPANEEAAQALRHFDEGRARGESLDVLFQRLESELGVDGDDEADTEPSPDFPGVVGAMVEEYLWDRGREGDAAEGRELLRELSRYGAGIGVFENLAPRDLLDFAGRWLLEESRVASENEARILLDTLADFSRWCEERHALALWSGFERLWRALREDVPRLVTLRPALADAAEPDADAYEVAELADEDVVLLRDDGNRVRVPLRAEVRAHLRPGDLLRVVSRPEGTLPCRVYPAVLRELLHQGERSA